MCECRRLQGKHGIIGDVRGRGLMVGVELVKDRQTKVRGAADSVCLQVLAGGWVGGWWWVGGGGGLRVLCCCGSASRQGPLHQGKLAQQLLAGCLPRRAACLALLASLGIVLLGGL